MLKLQCLWNLLQQCRPTLELHSTLKIVNKPLRTSLRISTNHRVMFRRLSIELVENECGHISYCSIEEVMTRFYRHHRQRLENIDIDLMFSKQTNISV